MAGEGRGFLGQLVLSPVRLKHSTLIRKRFFGTQKNKADGESSTWAGKVELGEMLIQVNGAIAYVIIEYLSGCKVIDIGDYYADCGRIKSVLGWEPRMPLEQTRERTVAFYRELEVVL